jgi:DNA polymerase (family X)
MKNQQISKVFSEMADLLELMGENVFRIRAYRRAAQNIDSLPKDVATLSRADLGSIPGIGKDLAEKIQEYLQTGKIAKHEELKKEIPEGVIELLQIPGLGPKTALMLYKEKNIKSILELETLTRAGKLAGLPGIQKKTEENILKGLERIRQGTERRPLGRVLPLAEDIIRGIKEQGRLIRSCWPEVSGAGKIPSRTLIFLLLRKIRRRSWKCSSGFPR